MGDHILGEIRRIRMNNTAIRKSGYSLAIVRMISNRIGIPSRLTIKRIVRRHKTNACTSSRETLSFLWAHKEQEQATHYAVNVTRYRMLQNEVSHEGQQIRRNASCIHFGENKILAVYENKNYMYITTQPLTDDLMNGSVVVCYTYCWVSIRTYHTHHIVSLYKMFLRIKYGKSGTHLVTNH